MKGFTWKDVSELSPTTAEEEFYNLFGNCNIWVKGKLVMKKGKIIDNKWYQKKLRQLRKGRRLTKKDVLL